VKHDVFHAPWNFSAYNKMTSRNILAAQAIAKNLDPSWPKPIKYLGGGVNGRVYNTNDGRLMKFVYNYAPEEFEALNRLQGTHVVPRFKKGNGLIMSLDKKTSRQIRKLMFPKSTLKEDLTVFVMSRVGGPHGMSLRKYLQLYPHANEAKIRKHIEYIISEIAGKNTSHGNLHYENIIVSVTPTGAINGMWAIDFGRAFYRKPGETERNAFAKRPFSEMFNTKSAFSSNWSHVPVREGSRANVHMMNVVYGRRLSPSWEQNIARRRKQVVNEMKQYRSPSSRGATGRSLSPRRTKSLSPRRSATRPSPRPRSAPARVSVTRKSPVRAATLKRKRA